MPKGPPTRAGRIAGVVVSGVFLVYLVSPINQAFDNPHPVAVRIAVVAAVAVYVAFYVVVALWRPWLSRAGRVAGITVMFACGITVAALLGPDDLMYMTYAISAALMQLPPFVGLVLGTGTTLALLIGTTIAEGAPDWNAASILVVLTVALFGTRQVILSNMELRAARDEI